MLFNSEDFEVDLCDLLWNYFGKALNAVDGIVAVSLYVTQSAMHKSNVEKLSYGIDCE